MNNQQISKILTYLRINFNFHSPYNFIIDGNFLKILVQKDFNLQQRLKPLIPGKIKLKVTKCTVQQLQILGHDFSVILQKAKQFFQLKCTHSFQDVDHCILDHLPKEQSLIVCSQDKILRRKLRNKGVGIMYFGPDQRITMEDIERHQFANIKELERQKFNPKQYEKLEINQDKEQKKIIEKINKKRQEHKLASIRGVELKYIKKKIVKGPNPLSVKKRKTKQAPELFTESIANTINKEDENKNQNIQIEKKKRIRKRNKKTKIAGGQESQK